MRKIFLTIATILGVVLATVAVPPAADAASYPVSPFRIDYGQTYTAGTITFFNRAIRVDGEQKSQISSKCRMTSVETYDRYPTGIGNNIGYTEGPWLCGTNSQRFSFAVPADVPGGAKYAVVYFNYGATADQREGYLAFLIVRR